jgi:hypothetical protein
MNDELGEVKAKIAATEADLTEAKRERKEDLVLMYVNLLVRLYDEEARVEARLSYITIEAYAIFCGFSPPSMFMISYYPIFIFICPCLDTSLPLSACYLAYSVLHEL